MPPIDDDTIIDPNAQPEGGVAEQEGTGESPTYVDHRGGTLEGIVAARRAMFKENVPEFTPAPETDDEPPPEEGAAPPPDTDADAGGDAPEGDGGAAPQQAKPAKLDETATFEITVDGKPTIVTGRELLERASLEGATRNRLDIATRTMESALALQESLRNGGAEPKNQGAGDGLDAGDDPAPKAGGAAGIPGLEEIDFEAVADQLQYGDKAGAAKTLKDLVSRLMTMGANGNQPQATPEAIQQRILDTIEWNEANRRFADEFADLPDHPIVRDHQTQLFGHVWSRITEKCLETGQPRPAYFDVLKACGDKTRQMVAELRGDKVGDGDPPDPAPTVENNKPGTPRINVSPERAAAKVRASHTPTPRGSQPSAPRPTGQQPDPAKTRQNAIKDMAAARGQHI